MGIDVRPVPVALVRPLRQVVLRPNHPPEACTFPGDDEPDTVHYAAYRDGEIVGIGSLYHEAPEGESGSRAWRLRGMATAESVRGDGYGACVLQTCIKHVAAQGGESLWCNARLSAVGFYESHGLQTHGDIFELPGLGPHQFMSRTVGAAD